MFPTDHNNTDAENKMLDLLFTLGQAASVMLLIYGGFLVLMPARQAPATNAKLDEMRGLHLSSHA